MCGIVYAHSGDREQPVNNHILQQFDAQRHRGLQGFGLFDGREKNMVHETKENKVLKWLVKYPSETILFHHRLPTSTINVRRAAHPFSTKSYFGKHQYILVHNGHISNSNLLRREHEEIGITYQSVLEDGTFNDSEALLWDVALVIEGQKEKLEASGGIAFICMRLVDGELDRLYYGRNSNPLMLSKVGKRLEISSEGKGELVRPQTLFTYYYKTNRTVHKPFEILPLPYVYKEHNYQQNQTSAWTYRGEPREGGQAGDWASPGLRRKFRKFIGGGNDSVESIESDYDREGNSTGFETHKVPQEGGGQATLYLPISALESKAKKEDREGGAKADEDSWDEWEEELESYTPPNEDVDRMVLAYLISCNGHFEAAYNSAEAEYTRLEGDADTIEEFKRSLLLGKVLGKLINDPDYIDETSVSPDFERRFTLWHREHLSKI